MMKKLSPKERQAIQENLVRWFLKHQRPLPWRKTYDPYQVWVSEIMLQQTQVKAALPYFDRWMKNLPNIAAVAKADEDTLMKLWEGLGYYSRVRNLQKAARQIMERHGGVFPTRFEDIIALPGIGRYSAGAIASIAFNQEKPVVDGNVIRVLARLFGFEGNTRTPENMAKIWKRSEEIVPQGQAREFNQGMMELGALVCAPRSPQCGTCPLSQVCVGFKKGIAERLPNRGQPPKRVEIGVAVAVIRHKGKIFIQKRPNKGLMGGLWEFPGGKTEKGERPEETVRREIQEELGITLKNVEKMGQFKYGYTKFDADMHCYAAEWEKGEISLRAATDSRWIEPALLKEFAFPAGSRKIIDEMILGAGGLPHPDQTAFGF